jgi:hypothetical protein
MMLQNFSLHILVAAFWTWNFNKLALYQMFLEKMTTIVTSMSLIWVISSVYENDTQKHIIHIEAVAD